MAKRKIDFSNAALEAKAQEQGEEIGEGTPAPFQSGPVEPPAEQPPPEPAPPAQGPAPEQPAEGQPATTPPSPEEAQIPQGPGDKDDRNVGKIGETPPGLGGQEAQQLAPDPSQVDGFYKVPVWGHDAQGQKIIVGYEAKYQSAEDLEHAHKSAQQKIHEQADMIRRYEEALGGAGAQEENYPLQQPAPNGNEQLYDMGARLQVARQIEGYAEHDPAAAATSALAAGMGDVYDRIVNAWEEQDPHAAKAFERSIQASYAQQYAQDAAQEATAKLRQEQEQQRQLEQQRQQAVSAINNAALRFAKARPDYQGVEARMNQLWDQNPQLRNAVTDEESLFNTWDLLYNAAMREREVANGQIQSAGAESRRLGYAETAGGTPQHVLEEAAGGDDPYEAEKTAIRSGIRNVNARRDPFAQFRQRQPA